MAYQEAYRYRQVQLKTFLTKLHDKCRAVKNDQRQHNYCKYISEFVSHFSKERVKVVGSTTEGTRLRANKDEGDFDYLIISGIAIPVEAIEHRDKVPCFGYIKADALKDVFPGIEFIDGTYLPSRLLKTVSKEAFPLMNGIKDVVLIPGVHRGRHHTNLEFNEECKPGTKRENYALLRQDADMVLNVQPNPDLKATKNQFQSALSASGISKSTVSMLVNIFSLIESAKTDESSKALIYQTFGGLIEAVSVQHGHCSSTSQHLSQSGDFQGKRAKLDDSPTDSSGTVTLKYSYKTSKDFIGAFPLIGKLTCLEMWKNRPGRLWPNHTIVDKIYNSEVYVVAKPCIINTHAERDFCLGFNSAEMILASDECMSKGQKSCILMLKAFQRCSLKEYSDKLTSFHWKTVFYWACETMDPSMFEEETLIIAVQTMLEDMIRCLESLHLKHYFIDTSNLFAHFERDEAQKMIKDIRKILDDPIEALVLFFKQEEAEANAVIEIPKTEMEKLQERDNDVSSKEQTMALVSLMSQLESGSMNDDSKITEALLDTLKLIVQDELAGKGEGLIKKDTNRSSLTDLITEGVKYSNKQFTSRDEKKKALDDLRKSALSAGLSLLFKK